MIQKKLVTVNGIVDKINREFNPRKAPWCNLITERIIEELPSKEIIKLAYLLKMELWLKKLSMQWKIVLVVKDEILQTNIQTIWETATKTPQITYRRRIDVSISVPEQTLHHWSSICDVIQMSLKNCILDV